MKQPIGQVLDNQGVRANLDDGELIDSAVVVMRVIDADGRSRVSVTWTDGQDFVTRRGLLAIASDGETIRQEDFRTEDNGEAE